jgi:hypothetical protein
MDGREPGGPSVPGSGAERLAERSGSFPLSSARSVSGVTHDDWTVDKHVSSSTISALSFRIAD